MSFLSWKLRQSLIFLPLTRLNLSCYVSWKTPKKLVFHLTLGCIYQSQLYYLALTVVNLRPKNSTCPIIYCWTISYYSLSFSMVLLDQTICSNPFVSIEHNLSESKTNQTSTVKGLPLDLSDNCKMMPYWSIIIVQVREIY